MLRRLFLALCACFVLASPCVLGQSQAVTLLTNGAATGSSILWPGGQGLFAVVGTFGGATATLQFLGPDGTTWMAVGSTTTVTAATDVVFVLPRGQIRLAITGGTSVSLTANAAQVVVVVQ